MSTNTDKIKILNLKIEVVKKDIKNLHLSVYPPNGRIRIAAPERMDNEVIRLFAISRLGWIKKHIKNFKEQPRETPRTYVSGESHYLRGQRYILEVKNTSGRTKVSLDGNKINIFIKSRSTKAERMLALREWYRKELKQDIPVLLKKWEKVIGVKCSDWGVKQMRTKWGACNTSSKRIWLNLELAKKPQVCLEYIIVHELVHLLERNHNDKFIKHMNQFMPRWRIFRDELNSLPISHTDWGY